MRGRRERRYLTEKYQRKQVRIAYATTYEKPYDPERYIRTEFARKQRFYDILCGNFVEWKDRWHGRLAIGNEHTFTKNELGRLRKQSFTNCGVRRCPYCANPRRGHGWENPKEQVTMQENLAELHLKEELEFYLKENYHEKRKRHSTG